MARYELKDGKSSKFWEIDLDGDSFTVRYGRIGTDGQTSTKVYPDAATAKKEADKLIKSKTKKGYAEVASAPKAAASAPAGNPEVEAAIYANPEDLDAWAVYGDWLQTQGDVRGEIVAMQIALARGTSQDDLQKKIDGMIQENIAGWFGKDIAETLKAEVDDYEQPVLELEWRFGFLKSVTARTHYDWEGMNVERMLNAVMKSSASRFIETINIGLTDAEGETSFDREVVAISKTGKRPSVRKVHVGAFEFPDETEISWTDVGSVDKLYPVFPNLEWLKVQGGGMGLGKLAHDKLETLILHTGGLPADAGASVAKANLPSLKELEIWFGADEYGGEVTPEIIAPLFTGKATPKLEKLGLMNAEFTNALPALLAGTPLLKQLQQLDLSMGTMTAEGADALLEHAEHFMHLERLSVDDNILTDEPLARLRAKFGDKLVSNEQKDYEEDWLYVSVGE